MAIEPVVGLLPKGWRYRSLGEVCAAGGGSIQTGPFGSQLHAADYVERGIPSIMPQNIGHNRVVTDGIARITQADAERLSRYRLRAGDIIYSRRGDVERRALVRAAEEGWLCGTGCLRVRFASDDVNPVFAFYYLGHPNVREWVVRHAHGATMPNLNTAILSALPVALAPRPEQDAIAAVLLALDDKIDLNRCMNETLDATARAIFKSWFVDFDPVRTRMEGRASATPVGFADLLPHALSESPIGKMPEGWVLRPLDKVAQFLNGLALQKYPAGPEGGLPVIKIRELNQGSTNGADLASTAVAPEYIIDDGDVLFSWSGSLVVKLWSGGKGALNQHLFKVTSRTYPQWFYLGWLLEYLPHFQHIAAAKATTMGHIQRHHLTEALVPVPPQEKLLAIATEVFEPMMKKRLNNDVESRSLASLRDALLPKLLSGELRTGQAEHAVAAAM